jgi:DNA-binding transcriptional MerR regulator
LTRLHGPDEPVYVISVAARLIGVSQQVLRQYERSGLLEPARTARQTRLYSERDLLRVRRIVALVNGRGVNLAGVRTILEMERRRGGAARPDAVPGGDGSSPSRASARPAAPASGPGSGIGTGP